MVEVHVREAEIALRTIDMQAILPTCLCKTLVGTREQMDALLEAIREILGRK
jgi:histidinol-phosphate/aromatic aminotransferase/cobyric acid decarboxylase-like protein